MNQDGPSLITPPPTGPPFSQKCSSDYLHIFYILLSFGVILRCLWGLEAYIMFMSSVDQCMLI